MNHPAPHYLLKSEASRDEGLGRWRFVLRPLDGSSEIEAADVEPDVWGERLDLLTVVRALESLDQPSWVTLIGCTRYVEQGVLYRVDGVERERLAVGVFWTDGAGAGYRPLAADGSDSAIPSGRLRAAPVRRRPWAARGAALGLADKGQKLDRWPCRGEMGKILCLAMAACCGLEQEPWLGKSLGIRGQVRDRFGCRVYAANEQRGIDLTTARRFACERRHHWKRSLNWLKADMRIRLSCLVRTKSTSRGVVRWRSGRFCRRRPVPG